MNLVHFTVVLVVDVFLGGSAALANRALQNPLSDQNAGPTPAPAESEKLDRTGRDRPVARTDGRKAVEFKRL